MQELVSRVVNKVGIDASLAQPAIGIILQKLKSVLPPDMVAKLMGAIPGAESLISAAEEKEAAAGTMPDIGGMIGGALGSLTGGSSGGALMEVLGKLQGLGLSTDQSTAVGSEVMAFIKEKAPADVTAEIEKTLAG